MPKNKADLGFIEKLLGQKQDPDEWVELAKQNGRDARYNKDTHEIEFDDGKDEGGGGFFDFLFGGGSKSKDKN